MRPRLTWARAALLALAVALGAGVNLVTAAWWTPTTGFTSGGPIGIFAPSAPPLPVAGFRKAVVWLPVWRPLRVTLRARLAVAPQTLIVEALMDGGRVDGVVTSAADAALDLRLTVAGERDGRVAFYCSTPNGSGDPVTITALRLAPELTWRSIARYSLPGLAAGVLFWLLVFAPLGSDPQKSDRRGWGQTPLRMSGGAWAAEGMTAAGAVIGLLLVWAVIKPPLQAPDEVHHLLRATSVPLGPWVNGAQSVAIDARHAVTLTWGISPILHGLIQHPEVFLTRGDIAALEAHPHVRLADGLFMDSAIASYPPLFYWYVFGATLVTERLALTPWQTLHALRFAVVLLAGVLWSAVYLTLRDSGLSRARASQALALLVATPMYAFLGSSVSIDAIAVPLAVWLVLLCWRALTQPVTPGSIAGVALALLFTRPTGIQIVLAIAGGLAVHAWRRPEARSPAFAIGRPLTMALIVSWAGFYAWSPPSLSDGDGVVMSLAEYAAGLPARVPYFWASLWGKLGWLEYQAPWALYGLVLAASLAAAIWMLQSRSTEVVDARLYFAVFVILLIGSTLAGELANVHRTGYMLQGRYLLPALTCLVPLFAWGPRTLRAAMLGSVGLLHATLFWMTIVRYWRGDLGAVFGSLPF